MKILAIETSCDETAVAIVEFNNGNRRKSRKKTAESRREGSRLKVHVLANLVSSQVKLHAKYGGVVPSLAKREHQKNLVPLLLKALRESLLLESEIKNQELSKKTKFLNSKHLILNSILGREPELLRQFLKRVVRLNTPKIDAVAVTYGPGLAPALWVGVNFAKALAMLWNKSLIPINHMAGHFYSAFLQKKGSGWEICVPKFPALGVLVSGNHTELVLSKKLGDFKILGQTRDDAAGEAFDKTARLLGLPYPGGPQIARLAQFTQKLADKPQKNSEQFLLQSAPGLQLSALRLPRPMLNSGDYDFSFSGLKTAVLYLWQKIPHTKQTRIAVAKEFQNAVVEVLVKKTISAAKEYKVKTVLLGGGVAANKLLRKKLGKETAKNFPNSLLLMPDSSLTGDNALMIALAAYFDGKKKALDKVGADANVQIG